MRQRILFITNIPNPYRIPLLNELNRQLDREGFDLLVVFGARKYDRRKWNVDMARCEFAYEILESRRMTFGRNVEKTMFSYRGLLRTLRSYRPDVALIIGFSPGTLKLWLNSWLGGPALVIWSGTIDSASHSKLRIFIRRVLARRASSYVAYGTRAKEYLARVLRVPADEVYVGINTVDTRFFADETRRMREEGARTDDKKHFVYVGYLSPRKRMDLVLDAVLRLSRRRDDFIFDIVGDGSARAGLEAFVEEHGLASFVRFHGYKQQADVPRYLAQAECFVFPSSYDVWGLVVVEAMAAGLPVLASTRAGVTADLVRDRETGFAIDFNDVDVLTGRLSWMLDHPDEARGMGRRASALVAKEACIERSAQGFVRAIRHAASIDGSAATYREAYA